MKRFQFFRLKQNTGKIEKSVGQSCSYTRTTEAHYNDNIYPKVVYYFHTFIIFTVCVKQINELSGLLR